LIEAGKKIKNMKKVEKNFAIALKVKECLLTDQNKVCVRVRVKVRGRGRVVVGLRVRVRVRMWLELRLGLGKSLKRFCYYVED
jgi:hypothetical protein